MTQDLLLPIDRLHLWEVRGHAVILDSDRAAIYGVTTGNFNKAVRRKFARFPQDFTFLLTANELETLIFQIGRSKARGDRVNCRALLANLKAGQILSLHES